MSRKHFIHFSPRRDAAHLAENDGRSILPPSAKAMGMVSKPSIMTATKVTRSLPPKIVALHRASLLMDTAGSVYIKCFILFVI